MREMEGGETMAEITAVVIVAVAAVLAKTGDTFVAYTNPRGLCQIRRVQKPGVPPLYGREMADPVLVQTVEAALAGEMPEIQGLGELHATWREEVDKVRASLFGSSGQELVVEAHEGEKETVTA